MSGSGNGPVLTGHELAVMLAVGSQYETDAMIAATLEGRGLLDSSDSWTVTPQGFVELGRAIRVGVQPEEPVAMRLMLDGGDGSPGVGKIVQMPAGRMERRAELGRALREMQRELEGGLLDGAIEQVAGKPKA